MTTPETFDFDAALIGGGIAGLWLAQVLQRSGYRVVLFEAEHLGAGQTLAAQGIVHSGIKYGGGTERSELRSSLAAMPARWRHCLAGAGEATDPNLSAVQPSTQECLLFSSNRGLDRVRQFAAEQLLGSDSRALNAEQTKAAFATLGFAGSASAVAEPVLPADALLMALQRGLENRCYQHELDPSMVSVGAEVIELNLPQQTLRIRSLLLCAGTGNADWLPLFGSAAPTMVRKPLHQVMVEHPALPKLHGHCLSEAWGAEPSFTVTSHAKPAGGWTWYLGGALASKGCGNDPATQQQTARALLERTFPGFPWQAARFSTLRIDRAEPAERPPRGQPFLASAGALHCLWPLKLALAPALADLALQRLPEPVSAARDPKLALPAASVGPLPWLRDD